MRAPPDAAQFAAQQQLIVDYVPLARTLAKPLKHRWPSEGDEIDGVCQLALVQAARQYDAGRGMSFASFLRLKIRCALIDLLRTLTRQPRPERLADWVDRHQQPVGKELEVLDFVETHLRKLPPQDRQLLRRLYNGGESLRDQAAAAKRDPSVLSKRHQAALRRIAEVVPLDQRA